MEAIGIQHSALSKMVLMAMTLLKAEADGDIRKSGIPGRALVLNSL
jgi:hypothetical protein